MQRKTIHVIGVPQDYGQTHRGVDMGPSALRVAGLDERLGALGHTIVDDGDLSCDVMETQVAGRPNLRFLPAVSEGSRRLATVVGSVVERGDFPLVLGGDHSVSIGTMAGLASVDRRQGVIWIDAHADFNTAETTPSGNIHGMALAVNLGYGAAELTAIGGAHPKALERNTVIVGLRSLDSGEREALRRSKITTFTIRDIDELGMREVMERAMKIAAEDVDRVHLSLDIDVIDPFEAPGVGTPVPGGITFREAHLALELLSERGLLTSMEVVEVNPTLDDRNRTSELAVGLITSGLGERIL